MVVLCFIAILLGHYGKNYIQRISDSDVRAHKDSIADGASNVLSLYALEWAATRSHHRTKALREKQKLIDRTYIYTYT